MLVKPDKCLWTNRCQNVDMLSQKHIEDIIILDIITEAVNMIKKTIIKKYEH